MKLKVTLDGMDSFKEAVDLVKQKAEELELAVQRLNETELVLKTELADD